MEIGTVILLTAAHLALTALPPVAAALLAARRGLRSLPLLLAVALAASGASALAAFYAYYADPLLGETWSYFLALGSAGLAGYLLWERRVDAELLRRLAVPLGLWALGTVFLVFLGFLHGGTDESLGMSGSRFFGTLPADNVLPFVFADWFFQRGHGGHPAFGEWLASDRPPLQIGYVLAQRPLPGGSGELGYQVLGVVLQQLWIVGAWALLLAARVRAATRSLAMIALLASDVAIVNGFFVWPKLLPAALLLAAAALVATPLWDELRADRRAAALLGVLFGLAMMGHGSSVFGVIPLLAVAAWRGIPNWRWVGIALLAALVVMVPWSAYQRYGEPPGDRLTKWMLAGVTEIDDRGTREAIVDAYGEAGLGGTIDNKAANFEMMAGGKPAATALGDAAEALAAGEPEGFARGIRAIYFFYLLPSLGVLLLALPAMLVAWRRRGEREPDEWRFGVTCMAVVVIGCLAWGLLLFGTTPARTSIHVGSLLLPLLAIAGAVAGVRSAFPRLAAWLVGASVVTSLALYVPVLDPWPDTTYSPLAGLLAATGLGGFWLLARRSER